MTSCSFRKGFVLFQGSRENQRAGGDKEIKCHLKRYVPYSSLFFLSTNRHLKYNLKKVSVHLFVYYLELGGKDSRESNRYGMSKMLRLRS